MNTSIFRDWFGLKILIPKCLNKQTREKLIFVRIPDFDITHCCYSSKSRKSFTGQPALDYFALLMHRDWWIPMHVHLNLPVFNSYIRIKIFVFLDDGFPGLNVIYVRILIPFLKGL